MAGNVFGKILTLTSFGESHGKAIGGIVDGFPAGLSVDIELVQSDLDRRRPGKSNLVSSRNEADKVEFLSGFFDGVSLGTPIAFIIQNSDQRSGDYDQLRNMYRPSHADFTYDKKYGIRDFRGGGRASARETIARVVAGSLAKQMLAKWNITIVAFVNRIGDVALKGSYLDYNLNNISSSQVCCPDKDVSEKMENSILRTLKSGDTLGGEITCVIKNMPIGIGEPVFDKLNATLAHAIMGINAVKGIEFGSGFDSAKMKGSQHNDIFTSDKGNISTITNYSGGIQGGISNGQDIYFRTVFKPVATIMSDQQTVDNLGVVRTVEGKGRHDVTVLPRAVPIVEAMAAMVVADYVLINRTSKV